MVKQQKTKIARRDKHAPMSVDQITEIASLFAVLSEPTRLQMIQLLQNGPRAVGGIVEKLGFKQANVSKQLGILHTAGVVERRNDGNRVIYSIAMPIIFDLCKLLCGQVKKQAEERANRLGA